MKKGTDVFFIKSWNNKGTFYYTKGTLQSFGKKQATLIVASDGKMLEERIYASDYGKLFEVATTDPVAVGLKLAAEFVIKEIAHLENCLSIHADTKNVGYLAHMRNQLEAVHANGLRCDSEENLHAELMAERATRKTN